LIEQTDFFIFLFYFEDVACTTTMIAKKSAKHNHKIFLIVAKNISLLAVGDELTANRRLQTLLLL